MRLPPRLVPLIDHGIIDRVVRPLMSGKEAQVYLVESAGQLRAAKVYKESNERSFHNRSVYAEGRQVRNSRDQRAMGKRSRHGRERDEEHWKSAEADIIYRLHAAEVRVPKPFAFVEGVLVMECIVGPEGEPAPRLAECTLEPEYAHAVCEQLIREVVRMLCVGVVHGDLSLFNVLLEDAGPVVIDFPQAVNAAQNRNAKQILLRDVANLTSTLMRGVPSDRVRFAHEMWALYEAGDLRPDSRLTGRFDLPRHEVDAERLLGQMLAVEEDEALDENAEYSFDRPPPKARVVNRPSGGKEDEAVAQRARAAQAKRNKKEPPGPQVVVKGKAPATPPPAPAAEGDAKPKRRRRRRRRGGSGGGGAPNSGGGAPGAGS